MSSGMSDPLIVGSALAFVCISFYFYFCTNACQYGQYGNPRVSSGQCDIDIESDPSQSNDMIEMTQRVPVESIVIYNPAPPPFEDDPPAYETLFPESVATSNESHGI
jgi:hypothetical protein